MKIKTKVSLKELIGICLFLLFCQTLIGQISLHSNAVNLSSEESAALESQIEDYTAYSLNPQEVFNSVQSGEDNIELGLNFHETMNLTFQLQNDDLRPASYFLTGQSEEEQLLVGKGNEKLLKGTVNNDVNQVAYFYATADFFTAHFLIDDEWYTLEPQKSITGLSVFQNTYILYKKSDVHTFSNNSDGCLTKESTGASSGAGHCEDVDFCSTSPIVEKDGIQRYLEVAVDVDVEFFNRYKNKFPKLGHLKSVEKVVLDYLAAVDAVYYKYFDLHIKLVYLNIWQSTVTLDDSYPYESSNIITLWDQTRNYWNDRECVHRDFFLLLSGRNNHSSCGVVVGNGNGGLCNASSNPNLDHPLFAYAVVRDFGPRTYKIIAHEMGHLFGFGHISETRCDSACGNESTATLMCGGQCGRGTDKFLGTTQCNIYSFLQNNDCFEDCAPTVEEGPNVQGPDVMCLGEEVEYEISIASTGSVLWDLGPNLELISGTLTSTTIRVRATALGTTYVQATFSHNCFEAAIRKYIQVSGFEIREIDPMCFSEDCAFFVRGGTYELFAACDNTVVQACWAISHPGEFFPVATQQDPHCANALVAFPLNNLSNRMVTLYAYDPNDPSNLLSQKNIYIPECEGPCIGDRVNPENSDQKNQTFTSSQFAFPNPADDVLTIQFPTQESELELSVLDVQGKTIFQKKLDPQQTSTQVSTSHWTPGFYFIQLKTVNTNYVQRLIIQH